MSCGAQATRNSYVVVDESPVLIDQDLNEKLETVFQLSSTTELEQFFTDWNLSVSSNTAEFVVQNNVIEAMYEVYKAFYTPFNLLKLGDWEWDSNVMSCLRLTLKLRKNMSKTQKLYYRYSNYLVVFPKVCSIIHIHN
jgi:hypothetical protein